MPKKIYTCPMKQAIFRLFAISGIVILWGVAAILLLRNLGFRQSHQALDHPLLSKNPFYLIAKGAGEGELPSNSYIALQRLTALQMETTLSPKVIAEIDLWLTKDRQWVLWRSGTLTTSHGEVKALHQHSLHDLRKELQQGNQNQAHKLLTMRSALSLFPKITFLLDIHHYEEKSLSQLSKNIHDARAEKRVIVHSRFPQVLRFLKKKEPHWLYFPDPPRVMQSQIMSSLFLETLFGVQTDFIFQDITDSHKALPKRMHLEALRRQQKVIAITETPHQWDSSQKSLFHGVMTPYPSEFLHNIKSRGREKQRK